MDDEMHAPARDGAPGGGDCATLDLLFRFVAAVESSPNFADRLRARTSFRTLFERSTDAIVMLRGREIIDANPAALSMFDCASRDDMVGRSLLDFSPPEQHPGEESDQRSAELAARAFDDGNQRFEWQYRTGGGQPFWAEVVLTSVAIDHDRLAYAVIRDISQRKSSERSLTMAAQVFENCRDAILILDAATCVVAVNQAYSDISGFAPAAVIGRHVPSLRAGVHEPAFYQHIWDYVADHDHWEGEMFAARANGEVYPVRVALTAIRNGAGAITSYMAILSDITGRKQVEEHTRHLAEHDFLTDLPNRVLFLDRLQQAIATARRQHTKAAVMFLDLDRFKQINDTHGHQTGDLVLKEVAGRLVRCVRGVDTVSRQGGDEFVVILADIRGAEQAAHVAGSVMHAVSQPMAVGEHEVTLSVSIGISICPCDGDDVDTLIKHADVAMYHAKQNGRNAYQFFSPEMNAEVVERVEMENQLRHALEHGEFVLEYQPEIDIASGLTTGVEALIRWRHPERGLLAPDQFLPIAEASGLIVPIGEWVLHQACARARAWRDQGYPVAVAVNLSNVQFIHHKLLEYVDGALAASGLDPRFLDLEVTEGMIMNGDSATIATVEALSRRGVQLTVDDFGTGCSSLSTLRRYRLSRLKIDRSFIGDITREPDDAAIVPAIIAVARSLKLRVVAEGVETEEQLRFLQLHGCDEYQGFYASMASSDPDLTRLRP
ncbi:EAL domain-containing protein [Massilia sp. R2A-15]|uniref:putative bifunctional diguanylate cyclase/phosphodiesterase n=1 Tax=Massilia sp. R2A-15 TaxID=3064278 RepID=UPI002732C6B9|nr:EAL domain-containing protein [Massilia sp. R2A-15]WLI88325.1 EAL domain-containing protein [Massilia sp. R2A-15]